MQDHHPPAAVDQPAALPAELVRGGRPRADRSIERERHGNRPRRCRCRSIERFGGPRPTASAMASPERTRTVARTARRRRRTPPQRASAAKVTPAQARRTARTTVSLTTYVVALVHLLALADLRGDDLPVRLGQQPGDGVRGEEQGGQVGVAQPGVGVVGVVGQHHQRPAAGHRGGERGVDGVEVVGRHVHERGGHEVEAAGQRVAGEHVGAQPRRPLPRAGLDGVLLGPLQRDPGHVDAGDGPAPAGEPDGVGALAAADVHRGAGRQVGDLLDQPPVRLAGPDALGGGVAVVPVLLGEHLTQVGVGGAVVVAVLVAHGNDSAPSGRPEHNPVPPLGFEPRLNRF